MRLPKTNELSFTPIPVAIGVLAVVLITSVGLAGDFGDSSDPGPPTPPPPGGDGDCSSGSGSSANPVRFATGGYKVLQQDIADPLGSAWFGHTRSHNNRVKWGSSDKGIGQNGRQWYIQQWPFLVKAGEETSDTSDDRLVVMIPGRGQYRFDEINGSYVPKPHQDNVSLTAQNPSSSNDPDAGELALRVGNRKFVFRDFGGSEFSTYSGCLNAPQGVFKEYQAPSGVTIQVVSYWGEVDNDSDGTLEGQGRILT